MSQSRSPDPESVDVDLEDVVSAAREHRPEGLRDGLNRAVAARGLGRCVDEVLLPAVRDLGCWRSHSDDPESTIRLTVETMRAWVETLIARAPAPAIGPSVIMACAPGDRHALPLETLALLLRYRRQSCRMLGSRVSARAMSIALEVNRPAAVVVAAQLDSGLRRSQSLLRDIDEVGITTFYAGAAFDVPLMPATRPEPISARISRTPARSSSVRYAAAQATGRPTAGSVWSAAVAIRHGDRAVTQHPAWEGRHHQGILRSRAAPSARSPMMVASAIRVDAPDESPGVRIAEVSRVLGVPMPTLRSWERRYDMPASAREPGKHRRYTPAELHSLRLMRDQIARGKPARAAALSVRELLAGTGPAAEFVEEILLAVTRSDPWLFSNS